jgi:hypothetical protein
MPKMIDRMESPTSDPMFPTESTNESYCRHCRIWCGESTSATFAVLVHATEAGAEGLSDTDDARDVGTRNSSTEERSVKQGNEVNNMRSITLVVYY